VRLRELWREKGSKEILKDKIVLINAGIIVFAASFILGSLAKQWWVYYVTSVISASLVGSSVLIDIKELHTYYEKLVPLIKEEIIHNVAFSELSKAKLMDMLSCLGKKTNLNTFVLVKVKPGTGEVRGDLSTIETISKIISQRLETALSEDSYLILPLSDTSLGIVLYLPVEEGKSYQAYLLGVLEDIREEIFKTYPRELLIGIGRSYDKIEDLRNSHREALNALEYAEQIPGGGIIHVENITGPNRRRSIYPVREKEQLLSLIRSGDGKNAIQALKGFFEKFHRYIEEEPGVLKIRLYELVCSFIDAAILGGGDEKTLNECASGYLEEIELIDSPELTECWLEKIVREIAGIVTAVYEKRSKVIIEKAKKYIEENYQSPLSYKDVARAVFISPSYFLSLFKRETGTTFVDYLTAVRIEKAKHTLLTTDLSITQIAYDLGFNNPNYFSNIFRKIVGVPASEYRKRG
ncbi:MAG TPA: helix-turn-helix domain-containing protein, partial [Spirochaetales bacterium]|nr:helix-turn-helix domain-containing protein [Spirochaetales bacterium]